MSLIRPKQQYRSALGIDKEILQICMDAGSNGVLITELSRRANLSHYGVIHHCNRLIKAGLMNAIRTNKNYIFIINEIGIGFFHEIERFHDIVNGLNIAY